MKTKLPRYVIEDPDRYGNVRIYYRKPSQKKVRLRGPAWSDDFWLDYRAASEGRLRPAVKGDKAERGSLRWVCIRYFESAAFRGLEDRTQRVRRGILERLCEKEGDKSFAKHRPVHIRRRRDQMAEKPEAANGMVKALRQLYKFAIDEEIVERNQAADVSYLKGSADGFHAWTIGEVETFEGAYPVGTKARLAFALLLYTGQRREDVRLFGPEHVRDGWLVFRQNKNRNRKPVDLELPIIPELQRIIDASPIGEKTFVATERGAPFASGTAFYNRFKKWCQDAGLDHCAVHGLLKAAASRLAELECTEHEIMSITGHRTSKEVARYTRAARQKLQARNAMAKLQRGVERPETVPPESGKPPSGTKSTPKALENNDDL